MFENCKVIELSSSDFNGKTIINKAFAGAEGFIMIFAPWCPHCQKHESTITKLAQVYNYDYINANFRVGIINTDESKCEQICKELEVGPIPTFKWVDKKGQLHNIDTEKLMNIFEPIVQ
jgi:thiol-disulfide isomerase/thioredoxin